MTSFSAPEVQDDKIPPEHRERIQPLMVEIRSIEV